MRQSTFGNRKDSCDTIDGRISDQPARLPTSFLQAFFFLGMKKVDRFPFFNGRRDSLSPPAAELSQRASLAVCGRGKRIGACAPTEPPSNRYFSVRPGGRTLQYNRSFVRERNVFRALYARRAYPVRLTPATPFPERGLKPSADGERRVNFAGEIVNQVDILVPLWYHTYIIHGIIYTLKKIRETFYET